MTTTPQKILQEYLDGIKEIEGEKYGEVTGKKVINKAKERIANNIDKKEILKQKRLFQLAIDYLNHDSPVNPITIFKKHG